MCVFSVFAHAYTCVCVCVCVCVPVYVTTVACILVYLFEKFFLLNVLKIITAIYVCYINDVVQFFLT